MRTLFTIIATYVVLVPNVYVENTNHYSELKFQEDKIFFDIVNDNGKIRSGDTNCPCETGCFAGYGLPRVCCDRICEYAEERYTVGDCQRECPWYDAIAKNIKIQEKIKEEKKRLKGENDKLNDVMHSQGLKDQRIQDLNDRLKKALDDIDLMFKVWILMISLMLLALGVTCFINWKTGTLLGGREGQRNNPSTAWV